MVKECISNKASGKNDKKLMADKSRFDRGRNVPTKIDMAELLIIEFFFFSGLLDITLNDYNQVLCTSLVIYHFISGSPFVGFHVSC